MARTAPKRAWQRLIVVLVAALIALPMISRPGDARGASTITVLPTADAYVRDGSPTTNYGKATFLRVRAPSPAYRSFLKFDVAGLTGPANGARLRLNVTDASANAGAVYSVSTGWTETAITWNNAPALPAAPIVQIGRAAVGWIEIDLGSTIGGNGTYAFAIATPGTDSLYASSREGANPPQLVLGAGTPPSNPPSTPPSNPPSTPPSNPPSGAPSTPPAGGMQTFVPLADAQVYQSSPGTNYGTLATLRMRAGPTDEYRSYLAFSLSGIAGSIGSARVRLFVTDPSPDGGRLFVVPGSWTETGITWSNAPPLPAQPIAPSPGAAVTGTWIEWDVSSVVTGNGQYSFALSSSNTNSVFVSSREGGSPPQLVVTGGGTPAPPVADFSSTATSGYVPLSVQFTDRSTSASSWAWDFQNDGITDSTAQNPMYTYTAAGTYSVRLTVTNSVSSNSILRTDLVTATDPPPPGTVTGTLVGAGDIGDCTVTTDEDTAKLLDGIPGTVFTAGDDAYDSGTAAEFTNCYDPTWGRHKSRTLPAAGNHEYVTAGASGYFGYFGSSAGDPAKGYYSTDVGGWHVVILNSNCASISGGCAAGGAQEQWLRADLAASSATCTLAVWHHALFSSGAHGSTTAVRPLWQALFDGGADLVVSGHDHDYERFAPQNANGVADPNFGIRELVVGTGGHGLRAFATVAANSEVREAGTFGVMKLTLHSASVDWEFVPIAGSTFSDKGSLTCHGKPTATATLAAQAIGLQAATLGPAGQPAAGSNLICRLLSDQETGRSAAIAIRSTLATPSRRAAKSQGD